MQKLIQKGSKARIKNKSYEIHRREQSCGASLCLSVKQKFFTYNTKMPNDQTTVLSTPESNPGKSYL